MVRKRKTIVPNDFRDFLSILSFIGFLAIFLRFSLDIPWLDVHLTDMFLIIAGVGLLFVGKVFSIREWTRDGIQRNETTYILALTIGALSFIVGVLLLFNATLSDKFLGFVGFVAVFPAMFILFDYFTKNGSRM